MAEYNALTGYLLDPSYDDQTGLGGYGPMLGPDQLPSVGYGGFELPWYVPVSMGAGALAGASSARSPLGAIVKGAIGGAAGGAAGFMGSAIASPTGPQQARPLPYIPPGGEKARTYLDDGLSQVNVLNYPTEAPIKPSGALSPVYKTMGEITGITEGALKDAEEAAAKGRQSPIGNVLGHLMAYGAQGVAELPGSVLRLVSAPWDKARGNEVDLTGGDLANVALAAGATAAGPAWRGIRRKFGDDLAYATSSQSLKEKYDALKSAAPHKGPLEGSGYRGSTSNKERYRERDAEGPWASDNPNVANTYAPANSDTRANLTPMRFNFENPLVVDAKGAQYGNIKVPGVDHSMMTNSIASIARKNGHDGVVFQNVRDSIHGGDTPSTVYHALQRGTTRSALTNELLYSLGLLAPTAAGLSYLPDSRNSF